MFLTIKNASQDNGIVYTFSAKIPFDSPYRVVNVTIYPKSPSYPNSSAYILKAGCMTACQTKDLSWNCWLGKDEVGGILRVIAKTSEQITIYEIHFTQEESDLEIIDETGPAPLEPGSPF